MIKKTTEAQQSAESEGEEGNLNNSDTNGNDIIGIASQVMTFLMLTVDR